MPKLATPARPKKKAPVVEKVCCPFDGSEMEEAHRYKRPPAGETEFDGIDPRHYDRALYECQTCGHFRSICDFGDQLAYDGAYVDATYGYEQEGLREAFNRVVNLAGEASDNAGRVKRIDAFLRARSRRGSAWGATMLDVGSGLCVFPWAMRKAGWQCLALDPDERACRHARDTVGTDAICSTFEEWETDQRFNLISMNKVLEHVRDPIEFLAHCHELLTDDGFVYLEVPDGEMAMADGPGREEFFIEHLHVFSLLSTVLMAQAADMVVLCSERLREPSGKYTLRMFLEACPG